MSRGADKRGPRAAAALPAGAPRRAALPNLAAPPAVASAGVRERPSVPAEVLTADRGRPGVNGNV
ncbi:unnamed protein product [Tetraodon nigroviridis]|uniref:Chromosome undetermined SCAF6024, whole genome shotgun sequence n=1 Tax=Tetraodon nigroviridis TaxID=99883 RepID=Q4TDV1_TETNG|nr:unnamed protein product [Tetraodon nigroviridis]